MTSIRKCTIHALALGVVLSAGIATSADGAGPLNAKGELASAQESWRNAIPGSNPMSGEEAAAAFALFGGCVNHEYVPRDKIDMAAFARDMAAGGNSPSDFREGGKYRERLLEHINRFEALVRRTDALFMVLMCDYNPYIIG